MAGYFKLGRCIGSLCVLPTHGPSTRRQQYTDRKQYNAKQHRQKQYCLSTLLLYPLQVQILKVETKIG